jgi:uncharacterized membrane protein YfcA
MGDFISLLQQFDHSGQLALGMAAVVVAYALFTLVGFGSALLASAPLALLMPVAKVIPLLAMLDFAGSSLRGWRARQELAWPELRGLLPGMLCGQLFGVLVLSRLPASWMAFGLGLFVVILGGRGLLTGPANIRSPAGHALIYGLFGGVLGGLFGSGGFVYASYLERRLASRTGFRATQAVLIALSTGWRIILCFSVGLIDFRLLATTVAFVPAMAVGVYLGHRLDLRIGREQLFRLLNSLLVASGCSLVLRFAG